MERVAVVVVLSLTGQLRAEPPLEVGFAECDITPKPDARAVWVAGFGHGRRATGIHDALSVRAVVLRHGDRKVAIASADVVGIFRPVVERVRQRRPDFHFVLVSATHTHHGPDTMGLWGPTPLQSGVDAEYNKQLEEQLFNAVCAAAADCRPATATIGTASAPELLHDSRLPEVKHDEMVVVRFQDPKTHAPLGAVVQWNCHPETIDSKNPRISSDFVGPACVELTRQWRAPVVYLTGSVGGLMTSMRVPVIGADGRALPEGSFEKTERYGARVAEVARRAAGRESPVRLTPIEARSTTLLLPVENKLYLLGRQLGVLDRAMERCPDGRSAVQSEISRLRLGELDIAVIPGEIYPELVLGKVQDPPDPNADFPEAPMEPSIYAQLTAKHKMIVGLGNDELGYIIPKRQWDAKPPHCYGLKKAPYGEVNSLGPDTAPLLCDAFRKLCQ
jgi:hypothetical protein